MTYSTAFGSLHTRIPQALACPHAPPSCAYVTAYACNGFSRLFGIATYFASSYRLATVQFETLLTIYDLCFVLILYYLISSSSYFNCFRIIIYYHMCLCVCPCPQLVYMSTPMSLSILLHLILSTPMPMPLLFIQMIRSAICWRWSNALCLKYESPVVSLLSPLPLLCLISLLTSHSRLPPTFSLFPLSFLSSGLWSLSSLLSPLASRCYPCFFLHITIP